MNTNPSVAGPILRYFSIAFVTIVGGVFAVEGVYSIAHRQHLAETGFERKKVYNTIVHPEQDRMYVMPKQFQLCGDLEGNLTDWGSTVTQSLIGRRS